jgi:hypothetical protein
MAANVAAVAPAAAAPAAAVSSFDGGYAATMYGGSVKLSLQISRGVGTVVMTAPGCEPIRFPLAVAGDGTVSGRTYLNCAFGANVIGANLRPGEFDIDSQWVQGRLRLWFRNPSNTFSLDLRRDR